MVALHGRRLTDSDAADQRHQGHRRYRSRRCRYTFNVAGKVAQASSRLPYAWADVSGQVFEQSRTVTRSGWRHASPVRRQPARQRCDGHSRFREAPRRTIVGVSVVVSAPTGQYYADKLINNRHEPVGIQAEVGLSVRRASGIWMPTLGTWLFARNDDYFPGGVNGRRRRLAALQGHGAYTFRPRLWLAADGTGMWEENRQW
jgi:hypothetical protein